MFPGLVLSSVAAALVATTIARYGFDVWLISRRARGDFRTAVVVAGAAIETATLVEFLELNPETGFAATATVGERPVLTDGADRWRRRGWAASSTPTKPCAARAPRAFWWGSTGCPATR